MKTSTKLLLSVSAGIMLSLSWPAIGEISPLIFISLVPILLLEREAAQQKTPGKNRLFPYIYLSFLIFNLITTWWIWFASPFGAVMAIILNALFPAVLFQMVRFTRKQLGNATANFSMIVFILGWEYFHMDWDLSWPWLTLGNSFANYTSWIQWYEYTGVQGGSLWILLTNLIATEILIIYRAEKGISKRKVSLFVSVVVVPVLISLMIKSTYEESKDPVEVVVVQPNIDPYNGKFSGISSKDQVLSILELAGQKVTPETQYVIAPETAIPDAFDEEQYGNTEESKVIDRFLMLHPQTDLLIGASTFMIYPDGKNKSQTARLARDNRTWYDNCNTAVYLSGKNNPEYYHKSKLVPGVEMMPFPAVFRSFQEFAFDLGGTTGSLARQEERSVFGDQKRIAPVICYESIYGEFVGDYIRKGAGIIFIITNDGWWRDTPGYKQHLAYARLRAIEHRKSIARSANTGISCFIDQTGEISQATSWWESDVIRGALNYNPQPTFYTTFGDYLGRSSLWVGILLIIYAISRKIIRKPIPSGKNQD
jgi:apolipoprotein N-acyltransferase